MALQSLGKFAVNLDKHDKNDMVQTFNAVSLLYQIESKSTKFYDIIMDSSHTLCFTKKSVSGNKEKIIAAHRMGLNSLIFANCSNYVRRKIYQDALNVIQSQNLLLVRIDVDSISICIIDIVKSLNSVQKIFSNVRDKLVYKVERNNLSRIVSYSKRAYTLECDTKYSLLKCCGLSLSFHERFNLIDFEKMYHSYRKELSEKGYGYFPNNNPPCGVPMEREEIITESGKIMSFLKCLPYGENK